MDKRQGADTVRDDACPGSFTEPETWSDGYPAMVLCTACMRWIKATSDHFSAASNIVPGHAQTDGTAAHD